MITTRTLCLFLPLALAASLSAGEHGSAASPYGRGTASSLGRLPQAWIRGGPHLGNSAFQFTLSQARPGAFAACVLATAPANIPFGGGTLLLDPGASVFAVIGFTSLSNSGDGAMPFPIPPFVGLSLYAQWAFVDPSAPGGLGLSDAVRITIRDSETALGVAGSRVHRYAVPGGPLDTQVLREADLDIALSPDGTLGMAIGPNGRQPEVFVTFDTSATPPVVLTSRVLVAGNLRILVHPSGKWAYVPRMGSLCDLAMDRLDIDRASATFGQRVATVAGLPQLTNMRLLGASICATRAVLASSDLDGLSRLTVIDVDPQSATRDQHLATYDVGVPHHFVADAEVADDGSIAYVVHGSLGGGGGISRVSLQTGLITRTVSHTENVPTDLDLDPRGQFLVCNFGASQSIGVLDLRPGAGYFQLRTFPVTAGLHMALSADGETVAMSGHLGGMYGYDLITGAALWNVNTPICQGIALR